LNRQREFAEATASLDEFIGWHLHPNII
jgi:hypothetical protein